jgi:hypothetical protein
VTPEQFSRDGERKKKESPERARKLFQEIGFSASFLIDFFS